MIPPIDRRKIADVAAVTVDGKFRILWKNSMSHQQACAVAMYVS